MPIFEYVCGECETKYEKLVRNGERVVCPECGSGKKTQQLSVFSAAGGENGAGAKSSKAAGVCPSTGRACGCH